MAKRDPIKQFAYGQLLTLRAKTHPNKEFIVFQDKRFTYAQLNERANRLANSAMGLGIQKGDKVGIFSKNNMEMVECFYGLTKIGAVVVPINFRYVGREVRYLVDQSDCKAFVYEKDYDGIVDEIRSDLPEVKWYICIGGSDLEGVFDYEKVVEKASPKEPDVYVQDDDPAFINYTSGTTGNPKGAVRTHKNEFIACTIYPFKGMDENTRFLASTPLYHSSAQQYIHNMCFVGAAANIWPSTGMDPEELLNYMQKERITYTWLVPSVWQMVLNVPNCEKYDLSSLKSMQTGGAITPLSLKKRMMAQWPQAGLYDVFGMTEMNPEVSILGPEDALRKPESIGKPLPIVYTRIWDDECNDVPLGEVGEFVYWGPSTPLEYYKNPQATEEAFRGGFFHSGDLVKQDKDDFIFLMGRKKDMIVSGGENIYPSEIEEVLADHPKIIDSAVIGLPDPKWGESVTAVIVLRDKESMTEKEIIDYCKENLASYKKPKSVKFVKELPRNPSGKVLKYKLRDELGE